MKPLDKKTVLITGATGFIGARLVEKIFLEHSPKAVRVLLRDYTKVPRIGCFPVELARGQLTDAQAVRQAAEGAEIIFHLAQDAGLTDSVARGLPNLVQAAIDHRARFVNVSAAAVYGAALYGNKIRVIDEETEREPITVDVTLARSKRDAEDLLDRERKDRGLDVTHVQPTLVYGPYSTRWLARPLLELQSGRIAVVDEGRGRCNAVYVDDVVDAIILAGTTREASGQRFLISSREQFTWKDFYGYLDQMLSNGANGGRIELVSVDDVKRLRRARTKQAARELFSALSDQSIILKAERVPILERTLEAAKRRLPAVWGSLTSLRKSGAAGSQVAPQQAPRGAAKPALPIHLPDETQLAMYQSRTSVAVYHAIKMLGYEGRFDLEAGMALSEKFARWAKLL